MQVSKVRRAITLLCKVDSSLKKAGTIDLMDPRLQQVEQMQREIDPARVQEIYQSMKAYPSKNPLVKEVYETTLLKTKAQVVDALQKDHKDLSLGFLGGQHSWIAALLLNKETEGQFFIDNQHQRFVQCRFYGFGALGLFDSYFVDQQKSGKADFDAEDQKVRVFKDSDAATRELSKKCKDFAALPSDLFCLVPKALEAGVLMREEFNDLAKNMDEQPWHLKFKTCRRHWNWYQGVMDQQKEGDEKGEDEEGDEEYEQQTNCPHFNDFRSLIAHELKVKDVDAYVGIVSMAEGPFSTFLKVLEKDAKLKLLDHAPKDAGGKNLKKPVFAISFFQKIVHLFHAKAEFFKKGEDVQLMEYLEEIDSAHRFLSDAKDFQLLLQVYII
jgi:hypothetical protein